MRHVFAEALELCCASIASVEKHDEEQALNTLFADRSWYACDAALT